jgi:hypothetical protein
MYWTVGCCIGIDGIDDGSIAVFAESALCRVLEVLMCAHPIVR